MVYFFLILAFKDYVYDYGFEEEENIESPSRVPDEAHESNPDESAPADPNLSFGPDPNGPLGPDPDKSSPPVPDEYQDLNSILGKS